GSLLEDDVHVGIAEIGEATDILHLRHAEQSRGDRVCNLILHDVGTAVPTGIDDDLGIGEIRNGVELCVLQGLRAKQHSDPDEQEHQELVLGADFNQTIDHCDCPCLRNSLRGSTTPPFSSTNASAALRSRKANVPGEQRSNTACSACSVWS